MISVSIIFLKKCFQICFNVKMYLDFWYVFFSKEIYKSKVVDTDFELIKSREQVVISSSWYLRNCALFLKVPTLRWKWFSRFHDEWSDCAQVAFVSTKDGLYCSFRPEIHSSRQKSHSYFIDAQKVANKNDSERKTVWGGNLQCVKRDKIEFKLCS